MSRPFTSSFGYIKRNMIKATALLLLLVINEKVSSFSPAFRSNAYRCSELDSYRLFESSRIGKSSLNMDPKDNQKQYQKSNNQITFLLTKAVELINKMTSKKKQQGNDTLNSEVVKKNSKKVPITLSFSSTHKHEILLKDSLAALDYLALPVEFYSVLDSKLVTRSLTSADTFILSLPLGDITSASMIATSGNPGVKLAATLRTDVTVRPDPSNGRVLMESGPIYFIPTTKSTTTRTTMDAIENDVSSDMSDGKETSGSEGFSDALPEWLLWGGRTEKSNENEDHKTVIDHEDDIIDKIDIYKVTSEEEAVKSSVQARFSIELKWTPPNSKNSEQKGFRKFFKSFFKENDKINREDDLLIDADEYIDIDGINSNKVEKSNDDIIDITTDQDLTEKNLPETNRIDNKIPEENRIPEENKVDDKMSGRDLNDNTVEDETPEVEEFVDNKIPEVEEDFLPVTAVVKVWVDVNLPVNKELSSTLSFPPIKGLLSQAGALTTKTVLSTLAPVLGKLLERDHDNRRIKNGKIDDSVVQESDHRPVRDSKLKVDPVEDIYDNLTADIEMK